MADENPSCEHNIEYHLIAMFEKLEAMRTETLTAINNEKTPMQVEIRTLEFWRSVISECLASFIYVFVVCGAAAGTAGSGVNVPIYSIFLATALASGFAMTSLTQCFGHISGAHINPSVSVAMGIIKRISLLRTIFFVLAQCGGAIAGAAFLYGVTVPTYAGNLSAVISNSPNMAPWEKFAIEFILTLIVVFSYFVSMDTYRKWIGTSSLTIGATYSACSFVAMSHLNPARSLGPSFVLNKYDNHWVYWIGPILGGTAAALIYEYIFNPRRQKRVKVTEDDESTSIHSDEMDNYDDLDKQMPPKFHGSNYNTYRASGGGSNYCTSLYSAPASKLERGESIYGGTKSLYCNSPPLTRANLNRSQSVYAKSNTFINKDILPKTGPLVPTQSMYPIRINQQSHVLNQNVQNFLQQKNEGIYGVRGITPGTSNRPDTHGGNDHQRDNYSTGERNYSTAERARRDRDRDNNSSGDKPYGARGNLGNGDGSSKFEDNPKPNRGNRPESMYGRLNTQQRHVPSAQSDDSSYSSYTANSTSRNGFSAAAPSFHCSQKPPSRPSQNSQMMSTASGSGLYHHSSSPNPQY